MNVQQPVAGEGAVAGEREDICREIFRQLETVNDMNQNDIETRAPEIIEFIRRMQRYLPRDQNGLAEVDNRLLNILQQPEYRNAEPEEQIKIRQMIKNLLLAQLNMLYLIICKKIKISYKLPQELLDKQQLMNDIMYQHISRDLTDAVPMIQQQQGGKLGLKKFAYKYYKTLYYILKNSTKL